jgi:hypothetical protein
MTEISRASRMRLCDQPGAVEVQRMSDQQSRIDLGVFDSGELECIRYKLHCFRDRGAILQSRYDSHVAPSAASNSA